MGRVGAELSNENHQQLWVPVGFAHGFLTLTELAEAIRQAASGTATASDPALG